MLIISMFCVLGSLIMGLTGEVDICLGYAGVAIFFFLLWIRKLFKSIHWGEITMKKVIIVSTGFILVVVSIASMVSLILTGGGQAFAVMGYLILVLLSLLLISLFVAFIILLTMGLKATAATGTGIGVTFSKLGEKIGIK